MMMAVYADDASVIDVVIYVVIAVVVFGFIAPVCYIHLLNEQNVVWHYFITTELTLLYLTILSLFGLSPFLCMVDASWKA